MSEKATVMFVDDEERILRSLKTLFRNQYNVITTTSGHQALAYARENCVHVVVSDQRMPQMPGVELLRQMRDISPATMRLLLTGYSDLNAIIRSINQGEIFRFINKPWKTEELTQTLSDAVGIAMHGDVAGKVAAEQDAIVGQRGKQFLVIDNDQHTVAQVRLALDSGQHRIHQVNGLDEALEYLANQDVAVVISESRLNGADLTTTLKTLRRFNPCIVTIVLTELSDTRMLVDLINRGQIYRFLPKPIRQGLLGVSLQSAIRHHHQLERNPLLQTRYEPELPKTEQENNTANRVMQVLRNLRQRPPVSTSV